MQTKAVLFLVPPWFDGCVLEVKVTLRYSKKICEDSLGLISLRGMLKETVAIFIPAQNKFFATKVQTYFGIILWKFRGSWGGANCVFSSCCKT